MIAQAGSLLIVDDDGDIRESMAEYLRDRGFRAETSDCCGDAITRLSERSFEVVVCDVNLPDRDGFHFLEWASHNAPTTAVILLTVLMPSWAFLPEPPLAPADTLFKLPPSMVMFLWASAVFLLAPPILILQNAMRGNIESRADLKMAWHATKRPIEDIGGKPVFGKPLLPLSIVQHPSGDFIDCAIAARGEVNSCNIGCCCDCVSDGVVVVRITSISPDVFCSLR